MQPKPALPLGTPGPAPASYAAPQNTAPPVQKEPEVPEVLDSDAVEPFLPEECVGGMWNVLPDDAAGPNRITATHYVTGRTFAGTIAQFNQAKRG